MEQGFFAPLQLPRVLEKAVAAIGLGRLRIVQGTAVRYLWFADQTVYGVTSALDDERLGAWLVARRRVMAPVLQATLINRAPKERLGSALIRRGLLSERILLEELEALSLALASRMLVIGGDYASEPGMVLPPDSRTVQAPPTHLFLAALRQVGDLDSLAGSIGDVNEWMAIPEAAELVTELGLTDAEKYILSLLQQPRSLDALRRVGVLDYADVLRALACLAAAGLISPAARGRVIPSYRTGIDSPGQGAAGGSLLRPTQMPMLVHSPTISNGPDPRLLVLLERLAREEEAQAQDGETGGATARRRADALAAAAQRLLTSGADKMTAYRLLLRAADLVGEAEHLLALARVEMTEERLLPRALAHLKQALERDPRSTEGWLALAEYWELRGSHEKQRRCLEKILAYEPDNEAAARLLATS